MRALPESAGRHLALRKTMRWRCRDIESLVFQRWSRRVVPWHMYLFSSQIYVHESNVKKNEEKSTRIAEDILTTMSTTFANIYAYFIPPSFNSQVYSSPLSLPTLRFNNSNLYAALEPVSLAAATEPSIHHHGRTPRLFNQLSGRCCGEPGRQLAHPCEPRPSPCVIFPQQGQPVLCAMLDTHAVRGG